MGRTEKLKLARRALQHWRTVRTGVDDAVSALFASEIKLLELAERNNFVTAADLREVADARKAMLTDLGDKLTALFNELERQVNES